MRRLPYACVALALLLGAFVPGDAAAQYYGGGRGGGYFGGGGGYHSDEPPRRSERREQRSGGQQGGGPQCYTKRSKGPNGQWQSEKVCE